MNLDFIFYEKGIFKVAYMLIKIKFLLEWF
jgi:hypothetical protein